MPTTILGMHERHTQYKEEYALIEKYIKKKENFIIPVRIESSNSYY